MKTPTRLYVVEDGANARLVRAHHPETARSFVARSIKVRVASQDDLVALIQRGVKPELARPENGELPINQLPEKPF